MFDEDLDLDFDEILNCSQLNSCSLKRQSPKPLSDERTKRQKQADGVNFRNTRESSIETKRIFQFTKTSTHNTSKSYSTIPERNKDLVNSSIEQSKSWSDKSNNEKVLSQNVSARTKPSCSNNISLTRMLSEPSTTTRIPEATPANLNLSDKSFTRQNSSPNESRIKRRFPGPAGLLPEFGRKFLGADKTNISLSDTKEVFCSQSSDLLFTDGPWEQMRTDYLPKSTEEIYLPNKFNIQWIKSRIFMKKLINQKAPFLAAYISKISNHSIQNPIVNIVLKDETGTINGTILHNLYEEYASYLSVGSVIVLKEMGVLNTGSLEPYLTITPNNLITIYTSNHKNVNIGLSQNSENKRIIRIQDITVSQILRNIRELKMMYAKENERIKNFSVTPKVINENIDVCNSFKKTIQNMKVKNQSKPNFNNLKAKFLNKTSSDVQVNESTKQSVTYSGHSDECNERIEDIMEIFSTKEGISEFFEEEPKFCSTQNDSSIKIITAAANKENSQIWENAFEGVDANSLFDDF